MFPALPPVNQVVVVVVVPALHEVETQQPLARRGLRNRQLPFDLRPDGDTLALRLCPSQLLEIVVALVVAVVFDLFLYLKAFNLCMFCMHLFYPVHTEYNNLTSLKIIYLMGFH